MESHRTKARLNPSSRSQRVTTALQKASFKGTQQGSQLLLATQEDLTCCSNRRVFRACLHGRIIIGNPTATDIMNPTRIISVTRLEGKFIRTFPAMASV